MIQPFNFATQLFPAMATIAFFFLVFSIFYLIFSKKKESKKMVWYTILMSSMAIYVMNTLAYNNILLAPFPIANSLLQHRWYLFLQLFAMLSLIACSIRGLHRFYEFTAMSKNIEALLRAASIVLIISLTLISIRTVSIGIFKYFNVYDNQSGIMDSRFSSVNCELSHLYFKISKNAKLYYLCPRNSLSISRLTGKQIPQIVYTILSEKQVKKLHSINPKLWNIKKWKSYQ